MLRRRISQMISQLLNNVHTVALHRESHPIQSSRSRFIYLFEISLSLSLSLGSEPRISSEAASPSSLAAVSARQSSFDLGPSRDPPERAGK